jgi:hypothetical protein
MYGESAIISFHKERIITIAIMAGLFGGLVGGPIASLANYYASPQDRFRLFIIPEFIGFACLGLMVYYGKSRKKETKGD